MVIDCRVVVGRVLTIDLPLKFEEKKKFDPNSSRNQFVVRVCGNYELRVILGLLAFRLMLVMA